LRGVYLNNDSLVFANYGSDWSDSNDYSRVVIQKIKDLGDGK